MEKELMPDYGAEEFCRYLIPSDVFEGFEKPKKELKHSVVLSKKQLPDLFNIDRTVAEGGGVKNFFNDENHMFTSYTKISFCSINIKVRRG